MKRILQSCFLILFVAATQLAIAQDRTVTGTVTAKDDGSPLPGVSVNVRGTKVSTQTSTNGKYSVKLPAGSNQLVFTYIGFASQTVAVGATNTLNVSLLSGSKELTEVVVTSYGIQDRSKSSAATTTIRSENIKGVPVASFDQILQGRAPGLQVLSGSGQPGDNNTNLRIRGTGSISGGNAPLYILDGVPIESGVFSTINPNDFESVSILKDASATSLYGSRGSNGVVVITTKKGKLGQTQFSYNAQGGISNPTQSKFDMMGTSEILKLQEKVQLGTGWNLSPNNPLISATNRPIFAQRLDSISKINTDWTGILFQTGKFQSHQVSASGGSEKTRFYTSLSYYDQEGIAIRSNLKRYNYRINLDHTSGRFKFGVQTSVGWSRSNFIESEAGIALANPFAVAYLAFPFENPYAVDGSRVTTGSFASKFPGATLLDSRVASNALDRIFTSTNISNQFKGTVSGNASFDIYKGLSAKTTVGLDFRESNGERSLYPQTYVGGLVNPGASGSFALSNSRNIQLISTSGLVYNRTFNNKHEFGAQALFEAIRNRFGSFSYTGYGINSKLLNTPAGITPGTVSNGLIPALGGSRTQDGFVSFIGIANYTYNNRYTLQASVRRDGSSKLPEATRYQTFYSVGGNWDAKKEQFLENVKAISTLRLRASYGTAANGNGIASNFGYLPTYANVSYSGSAGVAPSSPGNSDYNWEYSNNLNIGFDIGLFNDKLSAQVDVYDRLTKNLFISQELSRTAGFSTLSVNAGEVNNRGIEALLDYKIISNKNISWSITANIAYNKNEIKSLGLVNEFQSGTSIIRKGLPLGSHYIPEYGGVNPQTGDPIYVNLDGTTTNVYNASTQSVANWGTSVPPTTGGFGSSLSYKGFDMNAFFSFAKGYKRFNNQKYFLTNASFAGSYNQLTLLNNIWQKPGDITDIQRAGTTRQFSSFDIEDSSFLRFRNLNVGYTLPKQLLTKVKAIKGVRIYAQGQNLYTWTKWSAFDPEDNNNIASFEYPAARTFTFGLDLSL